MRLLQGNYEMSAKSYEFRRILQSSLFGELDGLVFRTDELMTIDSIRYGVALGDYRMHTGENNG